MADPTLSQEYIPLTSEADPQTYFAQGAARVYSDFRLTIDWLSAPEEEKILLIPNHAWVLEGGPGTGKTKFLEALKRYAITSTPDNSAITFYLDFDDQNGKAPVLNVTYREGESEQFEIIDTKTFWQALNTVCSRMGVCDVQPDDGTLSLEEWIYTGKWSIRELQRIQGTLSVFLLDNWDKASPSLQDLSWDRLPSIAWVTVAQRQHRTADKHFTLSKEVELFTGWEQAETDVCRHQDLCRTILEREHPEYSLDQIERRLSVIMELSGSVPGIVARLARTATTEADQMTHDLEAMETYLHEILGEVPEDIDENIFWELLTWISVNDTFYPITLNRQLKIMYPKGLPISGTTIKPEKLLPLLNRIGMHLNSNHLINRLVYGKSRMDGHTRLDYTVATLIRNIQQLRNPEGFALMHEQFANYCANLAESYAVNIELYEYWKTMPEMYRQRAQQIRTAKARLYNQ